MGITTKAMRFAGCLVVMFGVPADGLRDSVDQRVAEAEARGDKCCCLAFMESLETEPEDATLSQKSECGEYKKRRQDRPFWFHKYHSGYKARCCWTSAWFCDDFKEPHHRKPFSVDQYFHYRWCETASPNGNVPV
ncbi:aarA [Symbiodinium sp. CCMP2592]|nr:aarA [Symbiodinium sp. CCMP2592]